MGPAFGGAGLPGSDCSTHETGGGVGVAVAVAALALGTSAEATTRHIDSPRSRAERVRVALICFIVITDATI
jgi:hypothetical protein